MNTHTIGKAMIETAVKHGFKEMREDPKRSMRRLADLGRQFSKSRFQDDIFSVIQEVLQKEDSAYYTMIENALANINEESLETFGINVGYNAWVCGARIAASAVNTCCAVMPVLRSFLCFIIPQRIH